MLNEKDTEFIFRFNTDLDIIWTGIRVNCRISLMETSFSFSFPHPLSHFFISHQYVLRIKLYRVSDGRRFFHHVFRWLERKCSDWTMLHVEVERNFSGWGLCSDHWPRDFITIRIILRVWKKKNLMIILAVLGMTDMRRMSRINGDPQGKRILHSVSTVTLLT